MTNAGRRIILMSIGVLLACVLAAGIVNSRSAAAASVFTVDSTLDTSDAFPGDDVCADIDGNCTLRAAIQEANANGNPSEQDSIGFGLTGTADFANGGQDGYTFTPASSYDQITEPVIIDGYSQIGAQQNSATLGTALNTRLLVQITSAGPVIFDVNADNVVLKGMVLGGADDPGSGSPIMVNGGDNLLVVGNYVGTDPSGLSSQPNFSGITLQSGTNPRIGSSNVGDANLISANNPAGILVFDVTGLHVEGNVIGPDANITNSSSLSATQGGVIFVAFNSGSDNMVGGPNAGSGNIISGGAGVVQIGGLLGMPRRNSVLGNSIYAITGYNAIDLMKDSDADAAPDTDIGANTNDAGDVDDGPNDYLNTPVIHSAVYSSLAGRLFVNFDLDVAGSPSDEYHVEFFANDVNAAEGKTYIGSTQLAAGMNQVYDFIPENSFDPTGKYITATVTQYDQSFSNQQYGATSEFSQPTQAAAGDFDLDITKRLLNASEVRVGGTARYEVVVTNNGDIPVGLGTDNDNFGIYDMFAPGLSFDSVSGDDSPMCQVFPDQDAQEFLAQAVVNHTDHHLMYCIPAVNRVLAPGESSTMAMTFTVNSVPSDGFMNLALLFSLYDSDFIEVAQYAQQGGVDLVDLFDSGDLQGNGNVAIAHYVPGAEKLAASGSSTIVPVATGLLIVSPAVVALRKRRIIFSRR